MTERCYIERTNGVRFTRNTHRPDCVEVDCRGCRPCPEPAHCTAGRGCTWHVPEGLLTCGRCLGAARQNLRRIEQLAALALPAAIEAGPDSAAAVIAGPAADYETFTARRHIDKRWIQDRLPVEAWEKAWKALLAEEDDRHPYAVLTRWEAMLREDYGHDWPVVGCTRGGERVADEAACEEAHGPRCWDGTPRKATVSTAAAYLDRILHTVAQDDDQDFPLLASELRKCCQHLEASYAIAERPDRGAPCYRCRDEGVEKPPRLVRKLGHYCEDEACERMHYATAFDAERGEFVPDTSGDQWQCPRNREHVWSEVDYRRWVETRAAKGAAS